MKELTKNSHYNNNFEGLLEIGKAIIDNKLAPSNIKNPAQIVQIITVGRDLGMSELQSLNSIDIIQGQVAIKSKVIPGILSRNGVSVQLIKDYEPVMVTQDKIPIMEDVKKGDKIVKVPKLDEEGKVLYYKEEDGSYKTRTYQKTFKITERSKPAFEYVTTVRIKRYYPQLKEVISNDVDFYWSDAVKAGWTSKDNWSRMPKYMMTARCITRAARIAASDLIGGLYSDYETAEFTNTNMRVDDQTGTIEILNNN